MGSSCRSREGATSTSPRRPRPDRPTPACWFKLCGERLVNRAASTRLLEWRTFRRRLEGLEPLEPSRFVFFETPPGTGAKLFTMLHGNQHMFPSSD